jgi:hypothetical protein
MHKKSDSFRGSAIVGRHGVFTPSRAGPLTLASLPKKADDFPIFWWLQHAEERTSIFTQLTENMAPIVQVSVIY